MAEEDDALLEMAEAVADGRSVDWQAATSSDSASDLRLQHLRTLAAIARVCRMPPAPPAPTANVLFRWCHLEIRERIGEGVYGEVFLGWDTKLEREVAVKFLSAEATAVVPHVLQEGRHLARIRHPGVVMVFGAEEQDGRVGIWMEYVRGHTLEDWLQERGPFSSHEALLIGIDLCRALAAVHGAGLVHRDVKTRNVVREDTGRIVLMDLGAGFDLRSESSEPHGVAGTPIYLAPEVLRGDPPSPPSDLYGLGVLLYRLVTGSYPFGGATLDALREAHARGEMRPLSELRPELPAPFRRVVERALAPDPGRRFANAGQMEVALAAALDEPRRATRRRATLAALAVAAVAALGMTFAMQRTRTAPPGAAASRPPVAVADVVNEVRDPELDALAGMLTTSLDQARGLLVLTRSQMTDVLAATGRPADARIDEALGLEICRRERAAALLIPFARRVGDHYRITLDALEPRRGRRLFSVSAVAGGKHQFAAVIDTLSQRVRAELERGPAASGAAVQPVAAITTDNLSAYHRYDRGERLIGRLAMPEARKELERAVALDSSFALAHARLAYVCWWLSDGACEQEHLAAAFAQMDRVPERRRFQLRAQRAMADRQGLEVARSILLEMERFYPNDKEMLYDIGDYSSHLNEFPQAIQYLERVIAMDPDFARGLQHMARVYRDMGRRDAFLEWARRYAAADSVWDAYVLLGNALVMSGADESGIDMMARGRAVAPEHAHDFTMFTARSHFHQGRLEEGVRAWDDLLGTSPPLSLRRNALSERALGRIHQGACRAALADLEQAAIMTRREGSAPEEAAVRMDAATLQMVAWNDRAGAFRLIAPLEHLEQSITYHDTYFSYWRYWGGLFKLHLLSGDLTTADALARRKFAADKWYGPYVDAYLHAARGNCAQASAAASRILEWGPAEENIPLLYFMARCQLEHGRTDEAVESLLALQSLYSHMTVGTPYYARSLALLAEAYERRGENEPAARTCSKLLDLWRDGDASLPDRIEARRRLDRLKPKIASLSD